ncbi:hypothetical protein QN353_21395, partial [Undibacterium sp. 10I3]|nr:hypothetical protein [Undibacterium sp. 10I3]
AAVSFLIASVILRASRKRDIAAGLDNDLTEAVAKTEALKGKSSSVLGNLAAAGTTDAATAAAAGHQLKNIVFACDAGMGSSAMGAS